MPKQKILIVEDDPDMRRAMNVRLRANGYDTAFAENAYMAMSMARREQPDLILLDLGLPAGDGFTVLERLQTLASTETIPVIVASARECSSNEPRALKAGATAYLQKPVDAAELLAAIQQALGEANGGIG
jgi:DNA-binding response OmpR family regulator